MPSVVVHQQCGMIHVTPITRTAHVTRRKPTANKHHGYIHTNNQRARTGGSSVEVLYLVPAARHDPGKPNVATPFYRESLTPVQPLAIDHNCRPTPRGTGRWWRASGASGHLIYMLCILMMIINGVTLLTSRPKGSCTDDCPRVHVDRTGALRSTYHAEAAFER